MNRKSLKDQEQDEIEEELRSLWQLLKDRWNDLEPAQQSVGILFLAGGVMLLATVAIHILRSLLS